MQQKPERGRDRNTRSKFILLPHCDDDDDDPLLKSSLLLYTLGQTLQNGCKQNQPEALRILRAGPLCPKEGRSDSFP